MAKVLNVNDVLDGHVVLDLECLDRVYLNAYVPTLQVGGQVAAFMTHHLNQTIPSPAIFERIGNRFRKAVTEFAEDRDIPVLRFRKGDRRIDLVRPLAAKARPRAWWPSGWPRSSSGSSQVTSARARSRGGPCSAS